MREREGKGRLHARREELKTFKRLRIEIQITSRQGALIIIVKTNLNSIRNYTPILN